MDKFLIYIHDLYFLFIGFRYFLYIPLGELIIALLIYIRYKNKFSEIVIYLYGFANSIFLFLLTFLTEYIRDIKPRYGSDISIDIIENLNAAVIITVLFNGLPLIISLIAFYHRCKNKTLKFSKLLLLFSILSLLFFWGILQSFEKEGAQCEFFDNHDQKENCENNW